MSTNRNKIENLVKLQIDKLTRDMDNSLSKSRERLVTDEFKNDAKLQQKPIIKKRSEFDTIKKYLGNRVKEEQLVETERKDKVKLDVSIKSILSGNKNAIENDEVSSLKSFDNTIDRHVKSDMKDETKKSDDGYLLISSFKNKKPSARNSYSSQDFECLTGKESILVQKYGSGSGASRKPSYISNNEYNNNFYSSTRHHKYDSHNINRKKSYDFSFANNINSE